jgi:hypothetical protein
LRRANRRADPGYRRQPARDVDQCRIALRLLSTIKDAAFPLCSTQAWACSTPSRAVARVRAGESLLVTDRGKPVLRMVPEIEPAGVLNRMVAEGTATAPAEDGLPELLEDLLPEIEA